MFLKRKSKKEDIFKSDFRQEVIEVIIDQIEVMEDEAHSVVCKIEDTFLIFYDYLFGEDNYKDICDEGSFLYNNFIIGYRVNVEEDVVEFFVENWLTDSSWGVVVDYL